MGSRRERTQRSPSTLGGLPDWAYPVGAALLAVLAGVLYWTEFNGDASGSAGAAAAEMGPMGDQARREADDPLALGPLDAPVVMVMFSDFRCPFCARFSRETEPELVERYVDEGLLRIEWRDFPVFGEQSRLAARAGRAAADQGRFWQFTRAVYEAAPDRGHPDLTPRVLHDFAVQAGLEDLDAFDEALRSDRYATSIDADVSQARGLGISGTPSFAVNGRPIVGAQPTPAFVAVIEDALDAAGR